MSVCVFYHLLTTQTNFSHFLLYEAKIVFYSEAHGPLLATTKSILKTWGCFRGGKNMEQEAAKANQHEFPCTT